MQTAASCRSEDLSEAGVRSPGESPGTWRRGYPFGAIALGARPNPDRSRLPPRADGGVPPGRGDLGFQDAVVGFLSTALLGPEYQAFWPVAWARPAELACSRHNSGVATPVVFSWSAGKDSAFGLWTLLRDPAYEVRSLLTTITEGYDRVSMSGVREALLDRQAEALGLPVIKVRIPPACANEVYEQRMASTFAAEAFDGVDHVAFSDLFLEDVRAYREDRLAQVGKRGVFPLWGRDTGELAEEMVTSGFRAIVVCVDPRALDPSFAGRSFDEAFLADLPVSVDPCGENGEFHTFVWDAPMYREAISCQTGEVVNRDGFVYCDVVA